MYGITYSVYNAPPPYAHWNGAKLVWPNCDPCASRSKMEPYLAATIEEATAKAHTIFSGPLFHTCHVRIVPERHARHHLAQWYEYWSGRLSLTNGVFALKDETKKTYDELKVLLKSYYMNADGSVPDGYNHRGE